MLTPPSLVDSDLLVDKALRLEKRCLLMVKDVASASSPSPSLSSCVGLLSEVRRTYCECVCSLSGFDCLLNILGKMPKSLGGSEALPIHAQSEFWPLKSQQLL